MSLLVPMWIVVVVMVVVAALATLRWELLDFLLDRFAALTDWWRRAGGRERDAT